MKELKVSAIVENIDTVTAFVSEYLETLDCPMKIQMKIAIAIDEVFSNIAYYAYGTEGGEVIVRIEEVQEPHGIVLAFIDNGIPYNPLAKEDPDVTLTAEERQIGGMGIFMVKNIMDAISYEYVDGQNILEMWKEM